MTSANTRFTHTIHTPARGSRVNVPDESPTTTSSVHIPSENTNRYKKPNAALCVVDTQVSTAAITGAEHGAATSPESAPMTSAPEYRPAVPAVDARDRSEAGIRTGSTSSMASAATMSTFAIRKYNHGLVLTVPNSVPVSPANKPSTEYTKARPTTYVRVRPSGRQRAFRGSPS